MSSWMFDGEESQEEIRRRDTRQRQERNGEAAHVEVRTRTGNNSGRANRSSTQNEQIVVIRRLIFRIA